ISLVDRPGPRELRKRVKYVSSWICYRRKLTFLPRFVTAANSVRAKHSLRWGTAGNFAQGYVKNDFGTLNGEVSIEESRLSSMSRFCCPGVRAGHHRSKQG